ncbi:SIR2 family protein [Clostridium transplantifaecale]|uniref:SIR2 family protein n=1 Tax=Clostridium transplantifaecale TaxID=2479838 RepID=UPI0013DE13E9|nr:SIR2 family protein [Clostridium transplantifaecale]
MTIFNTHISGQIKRELANNYLNGPKQSNARITIWDHEDVVNHIGSLDAHAEYLLNPKRMLVEDKLSTQLTKKEEEKKRDILIAKLRAAYNEENVTVFLGAGVSKDAGVPLWGELTSKLLLRMISERLKDNDFENEHLQEIWELAYQNQEDSPLTQMRYIRTAFDDDEYYDLVREVLYENKPDSRSALLNAIVRLSTPRRNHIGVKSIVSYNFDDLLEQNLEQAGVDYKTIYREQDMPDRNRLSIYHVHGFLPKEPEDGESQDFNLVFSEEDYHRVYRDAYGWSNLVQLNAFRDTTCLFLGCSLTDPNMRRLLDVASRTEEKARHYAVLKRKKLELPPKDERVKQGILEEYQRIDNNIRESYYESLGINIIWVDRYDEIPGILKGLRGT